MWEDHQKAQAVFVPELAEPLSEDNNEVALYTLGDLRHLRVDLRRWARLPYSLVGLLHKL